MCIVNERGIFLHFVGVDCASERGVTDMFSIKIKKKTTTLGPYSFSEICILRQKKKIDSALCYTARSPTGCLIYEIKNVNKSLDTVPLKRLFRALVHNFILIIQNQLDPRFMG